MNRRRFLGVSGAVMASAAVMSLPELSPLGESKSLTLSIRSDDGRVRWLAYQITHCYLDGVDITKHTYAASTEGWADCYEHDEKGSALIVDDDLVEVRRYGDVRFEFTVEGEAKMREWGWA